MQKNLIVKDNALINASYTLDLVEQRLILLAIIEARKNNTKTDDILTIHVDSYINHFNVHRNTAYQALKDACANLFERRFSYQKLTHKGNVEKVISRWVQSISYVENEGLVRIKFSSDVLPLITNLEKYFTSYTLEQVSSLTSIYAIRLYELLISWRSVGVMPDITLEDFRKKMGILNDEYKRMGQLKEFVLNFAISQINKYTDINVKYEQHKQGRTITGFTFSFTNKAKKIDASIENKLQLENENSTKSLNESQAKLFASKLVSNASFGGQFAHVGEELKAFENRINKELQDAKKIKKYLPFLRELGLKI